MLENKKIPVYQEELVGLRTEIKKMLPEETLNVFDADAGRMGMEFEQPLKLKVGDTAPLFELPDALNNQVALKELLEKGPVIITFYRGSWCPYCNMVLNAYQRILPQIRLYGASLVAITPEKPDNSMSLVEKDKLEFNVLSDQGNAVARKYVHIYENSAVSTAEIDKVGVDIRGFNNMDIIELPVPGVYIIGQNGKVIFAKSEGGDYRNRVEPAEILGALEKI